MRTATSPDPLRYPGYIDQLTRAAARSGASESVSWEETEISGIPCVAVRFAFDFLGGSIGAVSGERLVTAIRHAAKHRLTLITHLRSGGCRVQEGLVALRQMQLVAAALSELKQAGVAHIAVADDPTAGGAWASLGADADAIIAVKGARIAFAGARVRVAEGNAVHAAQPAADVAFTAEGQLRSGFVDAVVPARALDDTVALYIRVLATPGPAVNEPCPVPHPLGDSRSRRGWDAVVAARAAGRPRAHGYLDAYFSERVTLSGDRASGADPGVLCGIGRHAGLPVAFAAQTGTATGAAGFRTAIRVLRLAERLGMPMLTLVDTPGAASDASGETSGVGAAIAQSLVAVATASVPVTSLVIGEGVSGGALALCAPGNTWITPDAYFTVIAPEAAAVLLRDGGLAREMAGRLRLAPADAVEFDLAVGIASPQC